MAQLSDEILDTPQAGPMVIRGSVLRVLGYGAGMLLSVGSAAVLLRYLSVADFGRYTAVLSLVTIVAGLTDAGMTTIGVREYTVREGEDRTRLMRNLLGMRLVLTLAGVGIAVGFGMIAGYTEAMVLGIALAGAALVLQVVQGTIGVPLQARLQLGLVTGLDLVRLAGMVLALCVSTLAGAGLAVLLAAPLPVAIVLVFVTITLVRGAVPVAPAFDRETWRDLLALTLPFAAATAVGTIYIYLTIVLMSLVTSEQETGIFGASFRVFVVLGGVPGLLVGSAFPLLARAARDDRLRLGYAVQRLFEICVICGIGVALVTIVAAPVVIDVLGGDKYADAVPVLRIQAIAVLASYLVALGGYTLLSLHRHRALLIANAVALVASAGLTLALAPGLGAVGAAYASVAGECTLAIGYLLALLRGADGIEISLATLPRVALAASGAGAVVLLPVPVVVAAVLCAVVFVGLLVALRALPAEVFEALRARR